MTTKRLTEADIMELRALEHAADSEPWSSTMNGISAIGMERVDGHGAYLSRRGAANLDLIVAMRNALPLLLDEIEELRRAAAD